MAYKLAAQQQNKTTPLVLLSILYEECIKNGTKFMLSENKSRSSGSKEGDTDFGAVMYIISVLVFYSLGIVVMIIKYLRTEKEEMEEEAALETFFKGMPSRQKAHESEVNQVAIQAFHTLTSTTVDGEEKVVIQKVTRIQQTPRLYRQVLVTDL
ncbi:hypothetical protein LOTGIDRAFT_228045 [Lottia gigantea]|uniref:Uncharacterized protein n=1 Tax=Lottia gigantea TaxID=225164 RepID=V4AMR3_LOTGI|nr:hypothetical protein LOTGIDRAFT_228045 [Lottia gigantea]ESP05469.1 hypothetical protein LOTGIDRAFT_228045 [Lottia gigantea]